MTANASRPAGLILVLAMTALAGCATTPEGEPAADPLEPMNRKIYTFNDTLDEWVMKPVARGYQDVTPGVVRKRIGNFFFNLDEPRTMVNDLLQAKPVRFGKDTARFVINTTIGLGGLFDVAAKIGLERHEEDFGQTLGVWGFNEGTYLMLPFWGPSTTRGAVGLAGDWFTSPTRYLIDDFRIRAGLQVLDLIDTRARLLPTERIIEQSFDPYVFIREGYLQRRRAQTEDRGDAGRGPAGVSPPSDGGDLPPPPPGDRGGPPPPPPGDRQGPPPPPDSDTDDSDGS